MKIDLTVLNVNNIHVFIFLTFATIKSLNLLRWPFGKLFEARK